MLCATVVSVFLTHALAQNEILRDISSEESASVRSTTHVWMRSSDDVDQA